MKNMKRLTVLLGIGIFLFAGAVYAGEKPTIDKGKEVTVTATVEAVDSANRMVTLKNEEGDVVTLKIGDQVRNFDQVKVGDKVVAKFYEALAILVTKGGEKGASLEEAATRAKPGERPAGAVAQEVTMTAKITSIDRESSIVTLQGPQGNLRKIRVRDPKNLENVDVGDYVTMTYTEAVAISVDKP